MNKIDFIKKMLPGFLPIIIFIVVDEFLGTRESILFALAFGIAEFVFIYFKERRFDKFIILDTLLLVLMGGVSILLDNDLFFKLKPALIEAIFVIIIGVSAFSEKNIIMQMSRRYMKNLEMNEQVEQKFRTSLKVFFWIILAHILLIVYSSYYMSKEAWAFISTVLFYIIFGIYFLFEFVRNKLKQRKFKNEEWLPLVDEEGKVIGKAPRSMCHNDKNLLHPVVHVHFFNDKAEIFLQKRPKWKETQAGKWDTAVGGHISDGETLEQGLAREVNEEIGLSKVQFQYIKKYIWESEMERELVYMFFARAEEAISINKKELDDGKFWKINEIENKISKGIFTPNFIREFQWIKAKMN